MRRLLAVGALIVLTGAGRFENPILSGEAFNQPFATLGGAQIETFHKGSGVFRQAWVIGPSQDHPDFEGLGPLYNRLSCIACHARNGRGAAPEDAGGVARSMVLRLSVPGADAHGGPAPHPAYGGQLNPEGVPGVPGEGRAVLSYAFFETALADGTAVPMRRPRVAVTDLAYGPLGASAMTSLRNAPPVFGLGLLEAVPEKQIVEGTKNGGKANYVFDVASGAVKLGRFGLKANQPSLEQQIAGAFAEDIGISSSLFPGATCTGAETACLAAAKNDRNIELSRAQLDAVLLYIRALAPPARRGAEDAGVRQGEALFAASGCSACHRESFTLAALSSLPGVEGEEIHPYTDLLLHDMGEDLADGRPDFLAGPREWRTPPLWGLGLAGKFGDGGDYLHDGRARSLTEAILWHGGEAQAAASAFRKLSSGEREALLAFLNSL
ncbi:di-heme oxidoredictase family protein [Methylocystis heyeri]|uniref:di-heme oxidoreductase family protein n=1 Tax=Methylocystis heyeri TaxID=391905 RepID=UPI00113E5E71|nr:di-heme oxidoredictase family protein [Methylocystis heyeri]